MVETWVLVAWLVTDPGSRVSLGTFTSQAECETRLMWLDEPWRKKLYRRGFVCVEVVNPECPIGEVPVTPAP